MAGGLAALSRSLAAAPPPRLGGGTGSFGGSSAFGSSSGFGPISRFGSGSLPTWSNVASGALSGGAPKVSNYVPATPPERFDLKYPVRGYNPNPVSPLPKQSTQGDVFGSVLGAVGDTAGSLNFANVVPWFMERVNVLANEYSKQNIPLVSDAARLGAPALDLFAAGVKLASDVAAPILNAFPDWVRDSQLQDRAKLYRAIAAGKPTDFGFWGPSSNPLATISQSMLGSIGFARPDLALEPIAGRTVSSQNWEYDQFRSLLLGSVDPSGRASIQQRMGILRETLDLPPSVKVAIERNPNLSDAEIEKLLSAAPEGRQWSYQAGPGGIVQNMGTPLLFYLSEARWLRLAGGEVSAFGAKVGGPGATLAGRAVPALAGRAVGTGISAAGKVTSGAAKLQTYAMAAGLGTTILTTTFDAVARWQGNQAAIDWYDRINRTTKFSDDPSVQLLTSFSVNQFSAIKITGKAYKAGIGAALHPVATAKAAVRAVGNVVRLPLAHGLGDIAVSAETAGRVNRFVATDTPMVDMIRRMYRLPSEAEARTFIDTHYENRGQAFDEVLGVALEKHLDTLPKEDRAIINAAFPDPIARSRHVAETYIDSAMTLLEKDAQAVADLWREKSWNHHGYAGRFNAELAAANAADFRGAKAATYRARAELNAVVTYREAFPPQAQVLAKAQLDRITLPDGTVPVDGLAGIDGLIEKFPVLRKHWQGLIAGERAIPRATADRILERATATWQREVKQNPVRAATGADPILRPNSPTLSRDTAEALGTSVETLDAIDAGAPSGDALSLVRRFVADKLNRTPEQAATLSPEEAVASAQKYVADTTAPWRRAGENVASAEKDMTTLRTELARKRAMPKGVVQPDEIIRLERQYAALNTLVRASSDPIIPFVSEASTAKPAAMREARDMALVELATRRAEAMTQLDALQAIQDAGAAMAGDGWHVMFRRVEGIVEYSGGLPAMSVAMRRTLHFEQMGDYEAWSTLARNLDRVEHLLTKAQRQAAHNVLDDGKWRQASPDQMSSHAIAGTTTDRAGSAYWQSATAISGGPLVEHLAGLWAERSGILAGTSEYALRRTAELALPPRYVAMADEMAVGGVERGILQDPLFVSRIHPANVASLEDALATPDTFPAARAIIEADPVLSDRYASFMLREGMVAKSGEDAVARTAEPAAPLAANEFYHGTTPAGAQAIESGGFSKAHFGIRDRGPLAEPEYKGVYVTKDAKKAANYYATTAGAPTNSVLGGGPVLRVRVEGKIATYDEFGKFKTAAKINLLDANGDLPGGANSQAVLNEQVRLAQEAGFSGVTFRAGTETLVFDPANAKSVGRVAPDVNPDLATEVASVTLAGGEYVPFTYDVLGDSAYGQMLRDALIPKDFVRPVPGVIVPDGLWDKAILANDRPALEQLARDLKVDETPAAPVSTPARLAKQAAVNVPKRRPSARYARKLADADNTASPDAAIMEAPANRIGMDVLSVMNHGIAGTKPATINRVMELLREIENGHARKMGIGDGLAAEAQRVANDLLDAAVKEAPTSEIAGVFTHGLFPDDGQELAAALDKMMTYDDANPLGTLQYGIGKPAQGKVPLEFEQVPGLAEELMTGHFQPYAERVGVAEVRQAWNWVFGKHSNTEIRSASKLRFLERSAELGVDGETASAIHDAWRKFSAESRSDVLRKIANGEYRALAGDNPLYADVQNIPNSKLHSLALKTIDDLYDAGQLDATYVGALKKVNYPDVFRESTSFIRRSLADRGGSLGQGLANAYGMAIHNKAVTTYYFWFRFGLDIRFHAMNYLESQFLYLGRAGLKQGEISQGQLGMTEQYLRNLATDPMSNTGYQFSRDRMAMAYRTMLKEQPEALRATLRGIQADDPALMQRALEQLARHDPQLRDMVREFDGGDPAKYLNELDAWHQKMLDSVTMDETGAKIDEALAQAMVDSPELSAVYARIGDANKELWGNIRETFYGNPNRSRAERFLNSYLLFWPLSYQIKSTKWFLKVLFDRMGGLKTNAGGAYLYDQLAQTHQQLLATDPEYQDWFSKNQTLVFVAQMMFPVNFDGTGVSLNPGMRSLFFGRNKAIWDVGPIYTFNHFLKPLSKELYADLYPTLKDVPGFDGVYRASSGQQEPDLAP